MRFCVGLLPIRGHQPKMIPPLVTDLAAEGVPLAVTFRVLKFSKQSDRKGCVHNVHTYAVGLGRIAAGLARIRDGFLEFPVIAGAGMRFESHLGHA